MLRGEWRNLNGDDRVRTESHREVTIPEDRETRPVSEWGREGDPRPEADHLRQNKLTRVITDPMTNARLVEVLSCLKKPRLTGEPGLSVKGTGIYGSADSLYGSGGKIYQGQQGRILTGERSEGFEKKYFACT